MGALEPEDVCEVNDITNTARIGPFLVDGGHGISVIAEEYGKAGERVLRPDTGDFVKWLGTAHPEVPVQVEAARKLVLHSAEVWLPLVFLGKDIALPVYLNMVSTYLYSKFKALLQGEKHRVHLSAEYIDEETGTVKRFTFAGDADALKTAIKKFDPNQFFDA